MLLPSYFDLHRIEANAVFGHLFKMTSPLTDHAIVNNSELLIHFNAIEVILLVCFKESTRRLNLGECVPRACSSAHYTTKNVLRLKITA